MPKPPGRRTAHERARLAAASRHGHDAESIGSIRSDLAAAKRADDIEEWLETWTPTPDQVSIVSTILNPGGGE